MPDVFSEPVERVADQAASRIVGAISFKSGVSENR
jgi:hypothetical protein